MNQNHEPFANAYDEEDRHGQMGEDIDEEFEMRPADAVPEEWDEEEIRDVRGIDMVREDLE